MNKQNALKILNYWYTFNFLEQESYPASQVKSCARNNAELLNESKKHNKSNKAFVTIAIEEDIAALGKEQLQQRIALEKKRFSLPVCGNVSIYLGKYSREECLLETSKALGQADYNDIRPEKNLDDIALMALQLTSEGQYIGYSLCLSPVLWSIRQLHNDNGTTDRLVLLSNENYKQDISGLEQKLFLDAESGIPTPIADAYMMIKKKYGACISPDACEDKCIITFQLFENESAREKYGDSDVISLNKSFFATDIGMVVEALRQDKLKAELIQYCDILNTEEENRRSRVDLVKSSPDVLKKEIEDILDINNAPLGKWPSKFDPALMQQIAINLQTKSDAHSGNVFSVNGPPGTGKTTLLKEIIVNNIVERAILLAEYDEPDDAFEKHSFVHGKEPRGCYDKYVPAWYTFKNDRINDYGILVASCNNTAVENISKELPRQDKITDDITPDKNADPLTAKALNEVRALFDADSSQHTLRIKNFGADNTIFTREEKDIFFSRYASNLLSADGSENAWGLIAAPLGKKSNNTAFYYRAMSKILNDQMWYADNDVKEQRPADYQNSKAAFLEQLSRVKAMRKSISDRAKARSEARQKYLNAVSVLKTDKPDELRNSHRKLQASLEKLECEYKDTMQKLTTEYAYLSSIPSMQDNISQIKAELDSMKKEQLSLCSEEIRLRREALSPKKKGLFSLFKKADNTTNEKLLLAEKIAKQISLLEDSINEKSRSLADSQSKLEELLCRKGEFDSRAADVKKLYDACSEALNDQIKDIVLKLERAAACEQIVSQYEQQAPADFAEVDDELIRSILSGDPKTSTAAQLVNPWVTAEYNREREKLFYYAIHLHKCFLLASKSCKFNLRTLAQYWRLMNGSDKKLVIFDREEIKEIAPALYQTLFLMVPVISSTFASVGRMFRDVDKQNVIGALIVDEAGQASPECVIGAMFRCRKAMIVGDPRQVEPVVTDELDLLRSSFEDETLMYYKDKSLSVQCFADRMNKFGTYLSGSGGEPEWVGCPLLVHRRCISPMYDISNTISYDGIMKQQTRPPKPELEKKFVYEKSLWLDVKGTESGAKNHYVKEQGAKACEIIKTAFLKSEGIPSIYIISPFTSVVAGVRRELSNSFASWKHELDSDIEKAFEQFLSDSIGTVHKFQGKEANEVIFLLGCDESSSGAVQWVNSNIVNVAVTRAKFRLYVIGDRSEKVWQKNQYLKTAMKLLDCYN